MIPTFLTSSLVNQGFYAVCLRLWGIVSFAPCHAGTKAATLVRVLVQNTNPKSSLGLNPQQERAVRHVCGPALVLAGAGAGKTRVLTERAVQLVMNQHASIDQILAVTFTNRAAREMRTRVLQRLKTLTDCQHLEEQLWFTTFHSMCVKILRTHARAIGFEPHFVIYDEGDQLGLIKKCLASLNIDSKHYPPKAFKGRISNLKMQNVGLEEAAGSRIGDKTLQVYRMYEQELRRANAMDFNDLLIKTYELFVSSEQVLAVYQEKFKFIMVDEYQDTNQIQYMLTQILAQKHKNLFVVGDEDQSIYSWRGANIQNILNFEQDFPGALIVKLEQNYRSTKNIIQAASSMIRNNKSRKDKALFSKNPNGSLIQVRQCPNEFHEARFVARTLEHLVASKQTSWHNCAVFYRTNAQSRVLEEEFSNNGIAYTLIGGMKFYARKEVKDMLSYLRLCLNPHDDVAFRRVVNAPLRGLGKGTLEKLERAALDYSCSLYTAALQLIRSNALGGRIEHKLYGFISIFEKSEKTYQSLNQLYVDLLDSTAYVAGLKKENTEESRSRVNNLEELQSAIEQFEKTYTGNTPLQAFLEKVSLASEPTDTNMESDAVVFMTLHLSKGLEFDNVFIVGNEEGLFPSFQSTGEEEAVEEERRLFYVGMTRAKKNLFISYVSERSLWGRRQHLPISRFVSEIPPQYISANVALRGRGQRPLQGEIESRERVADFFANGKSGSKHAPTLGGSLKPGKWVSHPHFGNGQIKSIEGSGPFSKIKIEFSGHFTKSFVLQHANLQVLER